MRNVIGSVIFLLGVTFIQFAFATEQLSASKVKEAINQARSATPEIIVDDEESASKIEGGNNSINGVKRFRKKSNLAKNIKKYTVGQGDQVSATDRQRAGGINRNNGNNGGGNINNNTSPPPGCLPGHGGGGC